MARFLFAAAGVAALAAMVVTAGAGTAQAAEYVETGNLAGAPAQDDNDDLFTGYISSIFYDGTDSDTVSLYSSDYGASVLDGSAYDVYSELKRAVEDIAAGELTSTVITLSTNLEWDREELGVASEDIVGVMTTDDRYLVRDAVYDIIAAYYQCLLEDCPYELYWFDKTQGLSWSFRIYLDGGKIGAKDITITMRVADAYQGGDDTTVDTSGVERALMAAANAKEIVGSHASESDLEKLTSYKDEICSLAGYDFSAALLEAGYGDPWQLVHVFDGDSSTRVVCEGYAKALQYLCELSSFDAADSACYTVTGYMEKQGSTSGSDVFHMWDIVTLDGVNYLADITNSDTGTVGQDGGLFLVTDGDAEGYMPGTYYIFNGYRYTYSGSTLSLLSSGILTLGEAGQAYGDSLAVRRGDTWYITYALRGGTADLSFTYGSAGDEVLVGDWDGDGVDTLAVRRGNTYYFKDSLSGGAADTVIYYGKATDEVLAGDWDGDGADTLTVRRGNTYYTSNSLVTGEADAALTYGKATDEAIAGDWDGDGMDTLAVRRGNCYYISNSMDPCEADKVVVYGRAADEVFAGRWYEA
ncbi:MAG: hypothetical protein LUE14_02935 [Clostridiales bacterium]|nr:hypothetical protein [Clostridiales bacterium]